MIFASGPEDRWSVFEEDMLLDAVEHHGFGSWLVKFELETVFSKPLPAVSTVDQC